MPKLNNAVNSFLVNELQIKLQEKFGYMIKTKPECLKLSQIIFNDLSEHISESTLYRFFILGNSPKTSITILNILARLIGFSEWDNFEKSVNNQEFQKINLGATINLSAKHRGLIYHNIALGCFEPLEALFEEAKELENEIRFYVVLGVFDSLRNIDNPMPFFNHFATNPFIRNYFFEIGFDPLFRINHYDEGIKKYAESVVPQRSIAELQDYIFSSTVLFRQYFLNKDYTKAIEYGKQLYQQPPCSIQDLEAIYAFPQLRYLSYKIWYLTLIGASSTSIDDYILWLLNYCKTLYKSFQFEERRALFLCVAESLIVANQADKYEFLLKEIFADEYQFFPANLYHKSLKYSLPYFDQNGLLRYRPA